MSNAPTTLPTESTDMSLIYKITITSETPFHAKTSTIIEEITTSDLKDFRKTYEKQLERCVDSRKSTRFPDPIGDGSVKGHISDPVEGGFHKYFSIRLSGTENYVAGVITEIAPEKNVEKDSSAPANNLSQLLRAALAVQGDHIKYDSGRMKTICTSNVLAYFGIPASSYKYSDCITDIKRILRKNGWSVRSRMSALVGNKKTSIGALRKRIADLGESGAYYVGIPGHAMLLDSMGRTIVDTAPRKRDRRQVIHVSKVTRNRGSSTFRF